MAWTRLRTVVGYKSAPEKPDAGMQLANSDKADGEKASGQMTWTTCPGLVAGCDEMIPNGERLRG